MKSLIVFFVLCLVLTSCAPIENDVVTSLQSAEELAVSDTAVGKAVPLHSELYIEGLSVDDVVLYFKEVVLDAEFSDGGDASLVQKWVVPIKYVVYGEMTDKDKEVLDSMVAFLNDLEGFPGISRNDANANMRINFCDRQTLGALMGEHLADCDGAVTYWYNGDNQIYDEIICYVNDVEQYTRNSVILEEIYNGLGPTQDTALRDDSIIYSGFSTPQWMTDVDVLILKLLYHPEIKCGMNANQCEDVIRRLYY